MNEGDYIRGERMAWLSMLKTCVRELGIGDPAAEGARWISEREQTVQMLRSACEHHGDNDWPESLHLADVVNKHLLRHLDANDKRAAEIAEMRDLLKEAFDSASALMPTKLTRRIAKALQP